MHVLSYVSSFDRNAITINPSNDLKKYWNGGFRNEKDKISFVTGSNNGKYPILTRSKENNYSDITLGRLNKNKIEEIDNNQDKNNVITYNNSSINSNNYIDRIWYTPLFKTSAVEADNDSNNDLWLTKNGDEWETTNAGTDFVVTKIKIPKSELNNYFPSLQNVIETKDERDWYPKLPNVSNNLFISPNQTFYTAGYPYGSWNGIKSTGGIIQTQIRNLSQDDNISYWTRYDEKINRERNTNLDKWKHYEESFKNEYNDLPHGMTLTYSIQNSILNLFNESNNYQRGGSSGSLTIDSKFNSIGILFAGLLTPQTNPSDASNFFTNQISLFNSLGTYKNWNGNIRNDITEKLKIKNIKMCFVESTCLYS